MLNLYTDCGFTFRFAEDRIIPRVQLDGIPSGSAVSFFKLDPATGERLGLLATTIVGAEGWVQMGEPLIVRAGDAFVAVPITPPLIRAETKKDYRAVRQVNRLAFGGEAEPRLVDALRAGGHVRLSLVAEMDGQVIGHILFSEMHVAAPTGKVAALALAPMSVLPDFQRQGVGSALVRRGLEVCTEQGHHIVIVLGHPDFYPRFGFSAKLASRLGSPFSGKPSFMAAELSSGALTGIAGTVEYPPPFLDL